MLSNLDNLSHNKKIENYLSVENSIKFIDEDEEYEELPKTPNNNQLRNDTDFPKTQNDKSITQKIHEQREFKNLYPCCDSKSEKERLHDIITNRNDRIRDSHYKVEVKGSKYLLLYHSHEFKGANVKYYNPRKGLEIIDGFKYNLMSM